MRPAGTEYPGGRALRLRFFCDGGCADTAGMKGVLSFCDTAATARGNLREHGRSLATVGGGKGTEPHGTLTQLFTNVQRSNRNRTSKASSFKNKLFVC